ncbi:MAG: hypothetical protein ACOZBW_10485 [Thermodesulfobacteriota bacterium]
MKQSSGYTLIVVMLFALLGAQTAFAVTGTAPPTIPGVGLDGASSMHGDIASSDTSPLPGPGVSSVGVVSRLFFAACPTVLIRSDGKPFVLSTSMLGRNPVARLLNQRNGQEKAKLSLEAGSLLGGVYACLDNQDRLVMVDGNQNLIRIKAEEKRFLLSTWWELSIDDSVSLLAAVTGHCGSSDCDAVVSISAGPDETIWFVTQRSVIGIYDPHAPSGQGLSWVKLGDDERIDNSFSTTVDGRATVVTNEALYLLQQDGDHHPYVVWRQAYDAGSARKPGQLSHGSGATPTFFGPATGMDYVMITDNADDRISLLVFDADDGRLVCRQPVFTAGVNSGTENSAIGIGNTVIIASTYGYPYPQLPEGAGESVPESADFAGGMVRVDIHDCAGDPSCEPSRIVWANSVRSAAVPKLSTADEYIYTVERSRFDVYCFTVIDSDTGKVLKQQEIGWGFFADTLQMAGNIGINGVYWQGTISGVVRIAPK